MIDLKKLAALGVISSSAIILSACNLYKTSSTNTNQESTPQQVTESPVEGNVITYSDPGFSPAQLKVKVGEQVSFKNTSKVTVQVNSVVHPTHTLYSELNIGQIAPGETKTTSFAKAGTYKYHNHLNAGETGTIVVE